jgi:serine/threonine-protein kinase
MIELGQTVGNYRITAKIGEGGMGMVYRAEHPVIARRAALKAIHPEFALSPEVISRFVNEAKVISQIGHEHIVDVTDFGRTDAGDFYFIMEYLSGEALSETVHRGGAMAPARALAIAAQIADALEASHACGIVHRDLKPENVFLIERGGTRDFVKVLDFGLAKLAGGDAQADGGRKTRSGMIMGTPYYMAPEQCQGLGDIDGRVDVYALGCILFELLTGMVPFGGETSGEILAKQISMRPPAARGLVAGLPEAVDAVLARALAKDPAERFPSMAAFREALLDPTAWVEGTPAAAPADLSARVRTAEPMPRAALPGGDARPPGTRTTFREGVGAFATAPALELAPARHRGRAWLAVAGAAAVLVALAAGRSAPSSAASAAAKLSPETIRLTFGSDPAGAEVVGPDGRSAGVTPVSIDLAPGEAAVRYVLRRPGFLPKTVSLIPNVSSPIFVALEAAPAADPPEQAAATPAPARPRRISAAHHGVRLPDPPASSDDVLAPSFR